MRSNQSGDPGFTLVEMLVVVLILGILAAIAIPTFLSQRERGWQAQLTSDVRNAMLDVEAAYVTSGGEYPDHDGFDDLPIRTSDPQVSLVYDTNSDQTEFCILGRHGRLPAGADVAHYRSETGLEVFSDCPSWDNP